MHGDATARLVTLAALAALAGCRERPSAAQLEAWRQEALAADEAARAQAQPARTAGPAWTLGLAGRVARPGETLAWPDVEALATTHVRTQSPQNPADPTARVDFRGIRVADLLERAGADAAAEDITFVAYDAFRSTVKQADARRFPITLAVAADGQPIARASGGPIFLVFPHGDFAETRTLYPDRYWCFYVTHMIVGTEPIAVRVGGRTLDAAALAALPQATQRSQLGFKVHWPSGEVAVHGVRLSAVLAAAGVKLPAGGSVTLKGKAPIQRDPDEPIRIAGADLAACDPLLVTHWGEAREPVPARLGGPVAVAIPTACATRYGDKYWVTFLEAIEATP